MMTNSPYNAGQQARLDAIKIVISVEGFTSTRLYHIFNNGNSMPLKKLVKALADYIQFGEEYPRD